MFQMYNTVTHNFKDYTPFILIIKYWLYLLGCTIYPCSLFILQIVVCTPQVPTPVLPLSPSLFLLVIDHQLVLYVFECASFLLHSVNVCSIFRFLIQVILYSVCLSLTYFTQYNTIHVVANDNISLFVWLSSISLCVYIFFIHLLMYTEVASVS